MISSIMFLIVILMRFITLSSSLNNSSATCNHDNEAFCPGLIAAEHHVHRIMENFDGINFKSELIPNKIDLTINFDENEPSPGHYVISPTSSNEASVDNLDRLLKGPFSKQRNHEFDEDYKEEVRSLILGRMAYYTSESFVQKFTATSNLGVTTVKGKNIVGILPGPNRGKKADSILLIGAHYDTTKFSPGVNDNGSGMAALLELVRLLSLKQGDLNNTIMFVAFDQEEQGILGSLAFVNEYLIPKELKPKEIGFSGAYILDMVLNFDPNRRSQTLPNDITRMVPSAGSWLRENRYSGDFLALISRKNYDAALLEAFRRSWYGMATGQAKYKLLNIDPPIPQYPHFISNYRFRNFMRSDHAAFWNHRNKVYLASLPAILITDTGPYRGVQRACYHEFCDDKTQITPENLNFLKRIIDSLYQTVVYLTCS